MSQPIRGSLSFVTVYNGEEVDADHNFKTFYAQVLIKYNLHVAFISLSNVSYWQRWIAPGVAVSKASMKLLAASWIQSTTIWICKFIDYCTALIAELLRHNMYN